jgi:orotate phosphoribosyltransferase
MGDADPDPLARRIGEVARLEGSFRLRSGLTAGTYLDKYLLESDPELLGAVAERMRRMIPADADILAGLELGGVPVVTALSLASGLPAVYVRKAPKEYGTEKLAEGPGIDGRVVVVVEDVVTTGGQVRLSTVDLRERGALVTTALCVIDREQGGGDELAAIGLELRPLFRMSDIEA